MPEKKAVELAMILSEGRWTHDFPLPVQAIQQFGLKVSTDMPRRVRSVNPCCFLQTDLMGMLNNSVMRFRLI
jgi:hypothetical protein